MKDLFVGASGRLNNHGGSRMFTTPHTIKVPPEYTVETDVPSVAEFVTCSLDGRLWVYRRSRRFYVAAFRWNEDTQRLVFVNSTILSNESFVMRGADWILTDKSLIQSLDNEPYISRTTYTDSSYLDAIKKSYSFFPEIKTWQEIQCEQIIRVDNSPSETFREMPPSIAIPREAPYYTDYTENDIQVFTEISPQLCYCNGQLYGKGKAHIGRAYLLPRTFSENGEPEDFYLYISPDYLRSYNGAFNDNDGWDNLRVAPFTPESVAIFTPQNDDYGICKKAENAQIITLPNGESFDLSANNGVLFFDALTGSNLALNDGGASLLRDGLNYECKGIRQWIAPSGKIDTVSPQLVMSSFDNGTLATHVQSGFHRELLAGKTLPLSDRDYSGKRLSLGEEESNVKILTSNSLTKAIPNLEKANWDNLYFPIFSYEELEGFDYLWDSSAPHYIGKAAYDMDFVIDGLETYVSRGHGFIDTYMMYMSKSLTEGRTSKEWLIQNGYNQRNTDGIYCINLNFYYYAPPAVPVDTTPYYFFYDTSSRLLFLVRIFAEQICTSKKIHYRPIITFDDTQSYIQNPNGDNVALRSIHFISVTSYSDGGSKHAVIKTELDPLFFSTLWQKDGG